MSERTPGRDGLSTDELAEAALRLDRIVGSIESDLDARLRERALELLEAVDAVHRPLVWYVAERIWRERPELFDALLEDETASVLFGMYGLVAKERTADAAAGFVAVDELVRTMPK